MPFAETSTGARLFYEHINPDADGLLVVVLHGLLGTGRKDLGHVLDRLAEEGYQVIAPHSEAMVNQVQNHAISPINFTIVMQTMC